MTKKISITTEFIKLGQLLKLANIIMNGAEAKLFLENNNIIVNGEIEKRRGRKIYPGYVVSYNDIVYEVISDDIH